MELPGSMFQHIIVMRSAVEGMTTEWLEPVKAKAYAVIEMMRTKCLKE